jgi:hypothetical protein
MRETEAIRRSPRGGPPFPNRKARPPGSARRDVDKPMSRVLKCRPTPLGLA